MDHSRKRTLSAEHADVKGNVYLRDTTVGDKILQRFSSRGEMNLRGIRIAGDLECSGDLRNPGANALTLAYADVTGRISLQHVLSTGAVDITGVRVGGDLDLQESVLDCLSGLPAAHTSRKETRWALKADESTIKGGAYLTNHFVARGGVLFTIAEIGGNLECEGGRFLNPGGTALNANGAKVGGSGYWRLISSPP